jgi:putative endonuclease
MKGRRAETLAAWWLRLKGYRILARRHATPVGEIDLIARRGRCLAFVEVKARPDHTTARHAIAPRQRRRIARAAEAYLQRRPELHGHDLRFDAVLVVPGRRPQHLPNAF